MQQQAGIFDTEIRINELQPQELKDLLIKAWETLRIENTMYTDANQIRAEDKSIFISHIRWWQTAITATDKFQEIFKHYLNKFGFGTENNDGIIDQLDNLKNVNTNLDRITAVLQKCTIVFGENTFTEIKDLWLDLLAQMRNSATKKR